MNIFFVIWIFSALLMIIIRAVCDNQLLFLYKAVMIDDYVNALLSLRHIFVIMHNINIILFFSYTEIFDDRRRFGPSGWR